MSEKKARQIRKAKGEDLVQKQPKDKASVLFGVIVTVVIVLVLALGIYAIIPEFTPSENVQQEQVVTVGDIMEEDGITLDEFKAEYGLEDADDITEESDVNLAVQKLNVVNYAKYTGVSVEELKSTYELGTEISDDMLWLDVIPEMTTGVIAKQFFGMDFETLKTQMGFPDEITQDTKWGKTSEIMTALYEEQQTAGEQ